LPDEPDPDHLFHPVNAPSAYHHRPELQELYRSWRVILDSYPEDGFPGARTAIGEVWADGAGTLLHYLAPGGLPQVFNFDLIVASWDRAGLRTAIDGVLALADGSRAPWVIGNHDVPRPASRYRLDEGFGPQTVNRLASLGPAGAELGVRRARAAALLLLALPGSAYIYQGEELGLPEVTDLPAAARQDPRFRRTHGRSLGRDGCRVPLPWTRGGADFGFSETASSAPTWLPQPPGWGGYSVEAQLGDPDSFLSLYRAALRLRRAHPALGRGTLRWLDGPHAAAGNEPGNEPGNEQGLLCFAREPGFIFAVNLSPAAVPLPPHQEILLASEPDPVGPDGSLRPDAAVWLSA
jgi:alpha-glucosidase